MILLPDWFDHVVSSMLWVSLGFYFVRAVNRKEVIACCGDYQVTIELLHVLMIIAMLTMLGLRIGAPTLAWAAVMMAMMGFYAGYSLFLCKSERTARPALAMALHAVMSFGMAVMFIALSREWMFFASWYYVLMFAIYTPLAVYYVHWLFRGLFAAWRARKLYWLAWGQDVFHAVMCIAMLAMAYKQNLGIICRIS